jgi:pyruvate/2-oxoglutarate dehydrogenase complex dihydrolipoamide acyltransferase (E2) component
MSITPLSTPTDTKHAKMHRGSVTAGRSTVSSRQHRAMQRSLLHALDKQNPSATKREDSGLTSKTIKQSDEQQAAKLAKRVERAAQPAQDNPLTADKEREQQEAKNQAEKAAKAARILAEQLDKLNRQVKPLNARYLSLQSDLAKEQRQVEVHQKEWQIVQEEAKKQDAYALQLDAQLREREDKNYDSKRDALIGKILMIRKERTKLDRLFLSLSREVASVQAHLEVEPEIVKHLLAQTSSTAKVQ